MYRTKTEIIEINSENIAIDIELETRQRPSSITTNNNNKLYASPFDQWTRYCWKAKLLSHDSISVRSVQTAAACVCRGQYWNFKNIIKTIRGWCFVCLIICVIFNKLWISPRDDGRLKSLKNCPNQKQKTWRNYFKYFICLWDFYTIDLCFSSADVHIKIENTQWNIRWWWRLL